MAGTAGPRDGAGAGEDRLVGLGLVGVAAVAGALVPRAPLPGAVGEGDEDVATGGVAVDGDGLDPAGLDGLHGRGSCGAWRRSTRWSGGEVAVVAVDGVAGVLDAPGVLVVLADVGAVVAGAEQVARGQVGEPAQDGLAP
jgi:hypothetical protein